MRASAGEPSDLHVLVSHTHQHAGPESAQRERRLLHDGVLRHRWGPIDRCPPTGWHPELSSPFGISNRHIQEARENVMRTSNVARVRMFLILGHFEFVEMRG